MRVANSPALQKLIGVQSGRWIGEGQVTLTAVGDNSLGATLSKKPFRTESLPVRPLFPGAA